MGRAGAARGGSRALTAVLGALAMVVGAVGTAPAAGASPPAVRSAAVAAPATVPTSSSAATATGPWTFSGRGFGHGVGMSQYGALAQAKAGRTAQQILASYYTGTTYDQVPDTFTIQVNIVSGATTTTVRGRSTSTNGGQLTVTAGGGTLKAPAGQAVTLRRSGASVTASCTVCTTKTTSVSGGQAVVTWDQSRTDLDLGGRRYRHAPFVVNPTPGAATLQGVLHLRLADEYLNQVREVPWAWPAAALEAQAAAARSYALRKVSAGVRPECGCHVFDSQADQVYGPVPEGADAAFWSQWRAAVAAGGSSTTGFVPRYAGQVIEALYSSSSGGRTVNNEDVFPTAAPLPYLRGVSDPWSLTADNPRRSWTTTVTGEQLAAAFGLPDVVRLDLSDRTSATTMRVATATTSTGATSTLVGNSLRNALGLPSAAVHRGYVRVGGSSPSDLAAASARTAPSTATSVVLASAAEADVAHLVMARPLAGALGAPLLLSGRSRLPSSTVRELDRRGPRITRAYLVAGSPMVSSTVVSQLRARGISVTRVGLSDKDATGAAVVDLMRTLGPVTVAGVSTQASVPAGGAFGAVAGARREPVVWSGPTRVGWQTRAALRRAGVTSARLLGPTTRIAATVEQDLTAQGLRVTRFDGAGHGDVSAQIVDHFRNGYVGTRVVLARTSSDRTSDAALAAGYRAPVLVVTASPAQSVTGIVQRHPQWPLVRAFGPTTRVSSATLTRVRDA